MERLGLQRLVLEAEQILGSCRLAGLDPFVCLVDILPPPPILPDRMPCVLREQPGWRRLRFTDDHRRRLAVKGRVGLSPFQSGRIVPSRCTG
jgi:hypothetical protein